MRQDEWKRIGSFTAHVNEVDADIVHVGLEMSELVVRLFVLSPVVAVLSVIEQVLKVVDIGACIPTGAFN